MPALNFKAQFADGVERGIKTNSIRPDRKNPIKIGDTLYLYTGMRTKQCRKLGEGICTKIEDIMIDFILEVGAPIILLDGHGLAETSCEVLARKDGFRNAYDFCMFFEKQYNLPFCGKLFTWELKK